MDSKSIVAIQAWKVKNDDGESRTIEQEINFLRQTGWSIKVKQEPHSRLKRFLEWWDDI